MKENLPNNLPENENEQEKIAEQLVTIEQEHETKNREKTGTKEELGRLEEERDELRNKISKENFAEKSQKDSLIKSGIAKIAIDSLWTKIDLLKTLKMNVEDLDFRVAYASDEKDPQITVEIPNLDPETKDRVPKTKFFISDKTVPNFSKSLNDEQKQVLIKLCEKTGVVFEEPDELVKEALKKKKKTI